MKPRRLLVPRDFSHTSELALDAACDLASRSGAELHLLHVEVVHAERYSGHLKELEGPSSADVQQRMWRRADGSEFRESGDAQVAVVRDIAPAPAIVRHAERQRIDLIVMGTHGWRGVRRFLLGSVTEEVVRLSPCSVLAVRGPEPAIAGRPVVVGVDFSESSQEALRQGTMMARLLGGALHVIHVLPIAPYPPLYGEAALKQDLPRRFTEETAARLRAFVERAGGAASVEAEYHVETGQPFREITEYAAREDAGLVVVGARGMTRLQQVLLGSVSERVLRMAPCAVLVTRLPQEVRPGAAAELDTP